MCEAGARPRVPYFSIKLPQFTHGTDRTGCDPADMKVFIPLGDELPAGLPADAQLVPYRVGLPLLGQLEYEILDADAPLSRCESPARRRDEPPTPAPSPR